MKRSRFVWVSLAAATVTLAGAADSTAETRVDNKSNSNEGYGVRLPAQSSRILVADAIGGGEGGEGGEGGVEAADAASDPVVFLTALDVIAAHVIAGRDIYDAGNREAGTEMFAHAISEIYVEIESVLEELGASPFMDQLDRLLELAGEQQPNARIDEAAAAVMQALDDAAGHAPASGHDEIGVEARVLAELIDRAARQYRVAQADGSDEAYIDGYGFLAAARLRFAGQREAIEALDQHAAAAIDNGITVLGRAFPSVEKDGAAVVPVGEPLVAASLAVLATSRY
ncbi:MAG: hypothetical protein R3D03_10810 [Geminicoccaceae bacterium]|nr:hypothetical protein [Geminicoccaceae bacterium]